MVGTAEMEYYHKIKINNPVSHSHRTFLPHYMHIAMPSQPSSVIEIPDDTPITEWVESEWIGKGKKYPASNVPLVIQMACSKYWPYL